MTGDTFDGKKAAEMGLVNESLPRKKLRARTEKLARVLLTKNQTLLRGYQDRDEARAVHGLGSVGRLSLREDG